MDTNKERYNSSRGNPPWRPLPSLTHAYPIQKERKVSTVTQFFILCCLF
jgi:hypothetical protein